MIWTLIAVVYCLCGVGVMLALDDDTPESGRFVTLVAALIVIWTWPLFFMFAVTISLRSLADGQPRAVATPRAAASKQQVRR